MSEDDFVTIADSLTPHQADVLHSRLVSAKVNAVVRDASSTSGELPGRTSTVRVQGKDEAAAREVLAEASVIHSTRPGSNLCAQCGEDTAPGMQRCLACVETSAAANLGVSKRPFPIGLIVGGIIAAILLYLSTAGTLD